MNDLPPLTAQAADLLKSRNETIAVAESAAGGSISATLLAVPGASASSWAAPWCIRGKRAEFLDIPESALRGIRPATEPYALLLARIVRQRFGASWAIGEAVLRPDRQPLWRCGRPACSPSPEEWNGRSRWKPGMPTA